MDGICLKLRGPCKPVCGICKGLDSVCDAGPGCECKTVGCELTCGVPAIEAQLGVWHIATDMFPSKLPAILYPLMFGCCPPCPGGKDEEMKDGNFSIGGPTISESMKITRFCCGCCSPYSRIKNSVLGLAIDPPFEGETPAWYNAMKTKVTKASSAVSGAGTGIVEGESETLGDGDTPAVELEFVSGSNFGDDDPSEIFGSVVPIACKSSVRVPSQLTM